MLVADPRPGEFLRLSQSSGHAGRNRPTAVIRRHCRWLGLSVESAQVRGGKTLLAENPGQRSGMQGHATEAATAALFRVIQESDAPSCGNISTVVLRQLL